MNWCAEIEQNGFAIIPNVFTPQEMDNLLGEVERAKPRRSRAGVRHALRIAAVALVARHQALVEIAHQAFGTDAFPFRATLFDKSIESNWLIVWHQDTALPLQEKHELAGWGSWSVKEGIHYAHAPASTLQKVLALRIHLDDSTIKNGPLRILPGTHMSGVMTDDAVHELSTRIVPVDCVVGKGGIIAMRPLVVHASSKCQIELPRRILHIEYAASESIAAPLELAIA